MISIADDYAAIAMELKRIEQDKAKALNGTDLPPLAPDFSSIGWPSYAATDYDPA